MRVFHFSLIVLLSLSLHGFLAAQSGPGAYAGGYARNGKYVFSFHVERADVRLEFCTPSMIRVRTSWNRKFEDNEPWMVVAYQWPEMAISASEEKARFVFQTARLKVIVQKTPFAVDVFTAEGAPLLSETALKGSGGAQKEGDAVLCRKQLGPDEHFFGFGERMDFVDQRNKLVKLNVGRGNARPHIIGAYNVLQANYCPVPFFMSTRGYGIFLHNSFANEWDMGATQPGAYSFKAKNGELDYYVIYGPTFPAILDQYTQLTGKAPLMPQFALGLQVGTYSGGTWGHEEKTSGKKMSSIWFENSGNWVSLSISYTWTPPGGCLEKMGAKALPLSNGEKPLPTPKACSTAFTRCTSTWPGYTSGPGLTTATS